MKVVPKKLKKLNHKFKMSLKPISWNFLILKIDRMMPFSNFFVAQPSHNRSLQIHHGLL